MNLIKAIIISLRPKQWIKNIFIFAAIVFVGEFFIFDKLLLTIWAFILFSLSASAIYLINDLVDIESDRQHPIKKYRPIAAGHLSPATAIWLAIILLFVSLGISWQLNYLFTGVIISYVILQVLYSFVFKRMLFLDVLAIAVGFVLRVAAGAAIISVSLSAWLILCTFFLTLYLAISKRETEYRLLAKENQSLPKQPHYTYPLLKQINGVVMPLALMSYTLYTFNSEHSRLLILTIPIVIYGIFRHMYIVEHKEIRDNGPNDDILYDRQLQATIVIWGVVVLFILLLWD